MLRDNFKLKFLPLFYNDMEEIVDYITYKLKNPDAADRIVDGVYTVIQNQMTYHRVLNNQLLTHIKISAKI